MGTRDAFNSWLMYHKSLTYSEYSKLESGTKLAIQAEYQGRKKVAKVVDTGA